MWIVILLVLALGAIVIILLLSCFIYILFFIKKKRKNKEMLQQVTIAHLIPYQGHNVSPYPGQSTSSISSRNGTYAMKCTSAEPKSNRLTAIQPEKSIKDTFYFRLFEKITHSIGAFPKENKEGSIEKRPGQDLTEDQYLDPKENLPHQEKMEAPFLEMEPLSFNYGTMTNTQKCE